MKRGKRCDWLNGRRKSWRYWSLFVGVVDDDKMYLLFLCDIDSHISTKR